MKRLMYGVLVAMVLAVPLFAQQQAVSVSFNIPPAKVELVKDALALRAAMLPPGQPQQTIDDAYVDQWVTKQCRQAVDALIIQAERDEARAGGPLDVAGLTRAQRLQVKALIASFR